MYTTYTYIFLSISLCVCVPMYMKNAYAFFNGVLLKNILFCISVCASTCNTFYKTHSFNYHINIFAFVLKLKTFNTSRKLSWKIYSLSQFMYVKICNLEVTLIHIPLVETVNKNTFFHAFIKYFFWSHILNLFYISNIRYIIT